MRLYFDNSDTIPAADEVFTCKCKFGTIETYLDNTADVSISKTDVTLSNFFFPPFFEGGYILPISCRVPCLCMSRKIKETLGLFKFEFFYVNSFNLMLGSHANDTTPSLNSTAYSDVGEQ